MDNIINKLFGIISYKLVGICLLSIIPIKYFESPSWVYFIPMSYVAYCFIVMMISVVKRSFFDK